MIVNIFFENSWAFADIRVYKNIHRHSRTFSFIPYSHVENSLFDFLQKTL